MREIRISNYILAVFSALALFLLSLPLAAPVRALKACVIYLCDPMVYYGAQGVGRLADVPTGLARLMSADMENQRLRAELQNALWRGSELEALRAENQRLSQALGLKVPGRREALWADTIERDPLHWYNSVIVNAGARQGVALNAPVLGVQGDALVVVGRITEVRRDAAVVLLATDEASSIAAVLSTAAVEGLVQGDGGPTLRMNYLPPETELRLGDRVFTSPTSATFPPGIFIGRAISINPRDPFLTFQSVEVEPALGAAMLHRVMILRPEARSSIEEVR